MNARGLRRLALTLPLMFGVLMLGQSAPRSTTAGQSGVQEQHERHDDAQIAALRSDLQRMRVLVNQMQMNLGFVQNTTTPLKHQFELEIEMWQILINQMERRLQSPGGKVEPGKVLRRCVVR